MKHSWPRKTAKAEARESRSGICRNSECPNMSSAIRWRQEKGRGCRDKQRGVPRGCVGSLRRLKADQIWLSEEQRQQGEGNFGETGPEEGDELDSHLGHNQVILGETDFEILKFHETENKLE